MNLCFFRRFGIPVNDFGPSWRDGHAFNAMIHNIRPELVDMSIVEDRKNTENLKSAFDTAENYLGIPKLIDPEDVDVERPDEKSIMTYVAQFLHKYPDRDAILDPETEVIRLFLNIFSMIF